MAPGPRSKWWSALTPTAGPICAKFERDAAAAFDDAFGANAPEAAGDLAVGVTPSVVFGWPAVRERLLCADLGLSPTILEVLKMAIIANGAVDWSIEEAMRLVGGDAASLRLELLDSATEAPLALRDVPREAYDAAVADLEPLEALRALIARGLFIDARRALVDTTATPGA